MFTDTWKKMEEAYNNAVLAEAKRKQEAAKREQEAADVVKMIEERHKNAVRAWKLKMGVAEDDDTTPLRTQWRGDGMPLMDYVRDY